MPHPRDFFISYNRADREWAEWIAWELEQTGYSTVLQAWDFAPGSNFILEMHKAAQETRRTIAVLSPTYVTSVYTAPEWAATLVRDPTGEQRALIPIRVEECNPAGLLGPIVYVDLVGLSKDEARVKLLEGVKQAERNKPATAPRFPRRRMGLGLIAGCAGVAAIIFFSLRLPDLYRLRVTVLDPSRHPVDEARVWSSVGGEPKRVAGGWEFTIPRASVPADGRVRVFAAVDSAFQVGEVTVELGRYASPAAELVLVGDRSAEIRGTVVDLAQRPVAGARVSVDGRPEFAVTGADGVFALAAKAGRGQQVLLRVERGGNVVTEWCAAGETVTLVWSGAR